MNQAAQEAFLEGIFGVLAISGDTQCGEENLFFMALEEFAKGRLVPFLRGRKKLIVGQLLRSNFREAAITCQAVLLCCQVRILLITYEKSFADSNEGQKQGDFAGGKKEKHPEME